MASLTLLRPSFTPSSTVSFTKSLKRQPRTILQTITVVQLIPNKPSLNNNTNFLRTITNAIGCSQLQQQVLLSHNCKTASDHLPLVNTNNDDNNIDTWSAWSELPRLLTWIVGPAALLATTAVPLMLVRIPNVFLGPNLISLLALIGVDSVFNLGVNLFLLMAHYSAAEGSQRWNRTSLPYKLWNALFMAAGFFVPLTALLTFVIGSGMLAEPMLPSSTEALAVLMGPKFLMLVVQTVVETVTWQLESPVWTVAPVVYEAYRLVQLSRGLSLGGVAGAPEWVVQGMKALVGWWIMVIAVQLMRVTSLAAAASSSHEQ